MVRRTGQPALANLDAIPEPLRKQLLERAVKPTLLQHLQFRDWLGGPEFADYGEAPPREPEWFIVGQKPKGFGGTFSISALLEMNPTSLEKCLETESWDVDVRIGRPGFAWVSDEGFGYKGRTVRAECGRFHPLVYLREFHGYRPSRLELDQEFLLYHNAFPKDDGTGHSFLDDDGNLHELVRETVDADGQVIRIRTRHLRDYLAARRCYLVRYHDNHRHADDELLGRDEHRTYTVAWEEARFRLDMGKRDSGGTFSRVTGKDILYPTATPALRHIDWHYDVPKPPHESFTMRDSKGHLREISCDEKQLSSYFEDKGTPHFLTPICFKPEVLEKYYADTDRYSVSSMGLSCLDLWSLRFDFNTADVVEVWLGDLASLPLSEQKHWKQYNIEPVGETSAQRVATDFDAEFVDDRRDPVRLFLDARYKLIESTKEDSNGPVNLPLHAGDEHLEATLRVPLVETQGALDDQIQALAKLAVDSLNKARFEAELAPLAEEQAKMGSLGLLEAALLKRGIDAAEAKAIVGPLRNLQDLRSSGTAHRKGGKWEAATKKLGIDKMNARNAFRTMALPVAEAYERLLAAWPTTSVPA